MGIDSGVRGAERLFLITLFAIQVWKHSDCMSVPVKRRSTALIIMLLYLALFLSVQIRRDTLELLIYCS
jgi:hypothetical protein